MTIRVPPPTEFADERAEKLASLRLLLPRLEHVHADAGVLPFGIGDVDQKLPGGGIQFETPGLMAPGAKPGRVRNGAQTGIPFGGHHASPVLNGREI